MKLNQYIKYRQITQEQAAKEIGISRQWLNVILKGNSDPGLDAIRKIIKWSDGDVRFEDLVAP